MFEKTKAGLLKLLQDMAQTDIYTGEIEDEHVAAFECVRDEYGEEDVKGFWETFSGKIELIHSHVWHYDNLRLELV
ncbi:hypothetical protein [Paenibacillus anseongense]|uniref:hypothetical protein n=1 Tax=Paenibacillus anseongense TaxID=2682845 RepID=UPI002DBDDE63|nr:hypothetical protein [Paenibacillus anseongense]MEC0265164.1 hypothetical protein [Paenibacillus anseongense]